MFKHSILLVLISLILSCTAKQAVYVQRVESPIPEHDVPFNRFSVDVDSVVAIHLETGTTLRFEASSFETSSGKSVSGKIDINVREFHTANELFRSGIPLTVNETRKEVLQSAGMIEVRAFQDGEALKLKEGKSGEISLAGFRPAEGYSLYHLGDDVRWQVKDRFESRKNEKKIKQLEQPIVDRSDSGFEIAADLKEVPYLIPFKGLTWDVVGGKQNKVQMENALRVHWDSVKVYPIDKKRKRFQLAFSKTIYSENEEPEEKRWTIVASPRLRGRLLHRLLKEQEEVDRLIAEEKRRLEREADMLNTFRINQMGIWNIDKVMKWSNTRNISLNFDFMGKLNTDIHNVKAFMILEADNSVVPIPASEWHKLVLPDDRTIHFIAILPGGKTVIADADQVKKALQGTRKDVTFLTRPADKRDLGM